MKRFIFGIAVFALLAGRVGQANAGLISIQGAGTLGDWGPYSSVTYGEVFTVNPGDVSLTSYTLTVGLTPYPEYPPGTNTTPFPFVSQVYARAGTVTNGAPLF